MQKSPNYVGGLGDYFTVEWPPGSGISLHGCVMADYISQRKHTAPTAAPLIHHMDTLTIR